MIKAILLDCGGVVCYPASGEWLLPVGLDEILEGKIVDLSPARVKQALDRYLYLMDEGQLITGLGHEHELRLRFTRGMSDALGAGLSDEQCEKIAAFHTYNDGKYVLYDDSLEAIRRLEKSFKVGFLSNALPSMIRALTNMGITDGLSCFTVSCLVGCQKPDEGIYRAALKEVGLEPDECVFVDDLEANIKTAGRLGINTICMRRKSYITHPAPDFEWHGAVARDMAEIERLVLAHNEGRREIGACAG